MSYPSLLSVAYLPPVEYFSVLVNSSHARIEQKENFRKQSYRNRTCILTANGPQSLSIPVKHTDIRKNIREVRIDYATDWQLNHRRALEAAYNNSPYFLFYKDYFYPFYEKRYEFLFDYNMDILNVVMKFLNISTPPDFTEEFGKEYPAEYDFRDSIHPKRSVMAEYPLRSKLSYPQVFQVKFGFVPNLSVIDLLFNLGNESRNHIDELGKFTPLFQQEPD